ncbi:hypothetical protein QM480_06675 [Flectobacillus sp. DC10W]|uniref:Uncharacterized protein n=1 Tax=Flectobacillus longus TaxID=2984207 RepID=A0ABT6YKA2_9BACT|nr:hypothetical protein [Flectobacillus longus]MDI9864000.1 hypothetical protein [Flectobacillus longus]
MINQEQEEIQIIESNVGIEVFEAQERASIDIQIATAKRYPRDLRKVLDNSIVIATLDKDTAAKCRYAKPVGLKNVNGPSVHLTRILYQQYGNLRVHPRVKQITDRTIIAEAVAFDLENNLAVCVEAHRSIIGKDGRRFTDSVIQTNIMAVLSIAERNAILRVIPKMIIDKVYNEAFTFAFGDLSDRAKFLKQRDKLFKAFKDYGMTEMEVVKCLGLANKEAINAENLADLTGYLQAIKDNELTVEELRGKGKKDVVSKKEELKNKKSQTKAPEML